MDAQMRYFGQVLLNKPGFGTRCMVDEPLEWVAFANPVNFSINCPLCCSVWLYGSIFFFALVEISHVTTSPQSGRCPLWTLYWLINWLGQNGPHSDHLLNASAAHPKNSPCSQCVPRELEACHLHRYTLNIYYKGVLQSPTYTTLLPCITTELM